MKSFILSVGRHKLYPYICILLVTFAFIATSPFENLNFRYIASYLGAIAGLICVILLAKGKNSGNVMGLLAAGGESTGNFLGNNIGAALPSLYYFCSHIYGLITWKKHQNSQKIILVRTLKENQFFVILIFIIIGALLNILITDMANVKNDAYQLTINNFIFALGVTAQFIMIQRYSFNWYIWGIYNVLIIGLNIYTNNPIIAVQYCIYLFNVIYGVIEWYEELGKDESQTS